MKVTDKVKVLTGNEQIPKEYQGREGTISSIDDSQVVNLITVKFENPFGVCILFEEEFELVEV